MQFWSDIWIKLGFRSGLSSFVFLKASTLYNFYQSQSQEVARKFEQLGPPCQPRARPKLN